jgi:hypothetical protein
VASPLENLSGSGALRKLPSAPHEDVLRGHRPTLLRAVRVGGLLPCAYHPTQIRQRTWLALRSGATGDHPGQDRKLERECLSDGGVSSLFLDGRLFELDAPLGEVRQGDLDACGEGAQGLAVGIELSEFEALPTDP